MANALFVCLHNAGRSQMSQALFERAAAGRHGARSAGTTPGERVHPEAVEAMREIGIDLSGRVPRRLTEEDARWADVVVTMGCGDECPYIPGRRYVDWDLPDPKGRPVEEVRATREEIARRVEELVAELDRALYDRQVATLVASWRAYARHSAGASVLDLEGAAVCRFPSAPESAVYNNALLPRGLDAARAEAVVAAVEDAYREAAIPAYAIWAHEAESDAVAALASRGLRLDTSTRAMAMSLDALTVPRPEIELGDLDWAGYAERFMGMPGLLSGAPAAEFHLRVARLDGRDVGAVIAYDHDGDCGVFNLATLPDARRRGIGTALTAIQLHEARERGRTTASLQSTLIAESLYAAIGFADLGRYLEYVPAGRTAEAAAEVNGRRVNEAIERGAQGTGIAVFVCECGNLGCTEKVELTIAEYESVRSGFERFLIVPGHEIEAIEDVVERHSAYLVVAKRDDEAVEMAHAADDRDDG